MNDVDTVKELLASINDMLGSIYEICEEVPEQLGPVVIELSKAYALIVDAYEKMNY